MSWKNIASKIVDAAPMLSTLIGGPAGAAAGTAIKLVANALGVQETPETVEAALQSNPDALLKIKELELAHKAEIRGLLIAAETARIQAVNKTMQEESKSEHWPQYSWRPYWGFISGTAFLVVCIFVCVLGYKTIVEKDATAFGQIPMIIGAFASLFAIPGTILGVTAWGRNKMKEKLTGVS